MASRAQLHEQLCSVLGSRHVYFQPPESVKLSYPCIVYSFTGLDSAKADDRSYLLTNQYSVLLITKDPENSLTKSLAMAFPMIRHSRHFISDNLQHDEYTLYY